MKVGLGDFEVLIVWFLFGECVSVVEFKMVVCKWFVDDGWMIVVNVGD